AYIWPLSGALTQRGSFSMRTLFSRCLTVSLILGGLVACRPTHVPSFSNPLSTTGAPLNNGAQGTSEAPRPSPNPASSRAVGAHPPGAHQQPQSPAPAAAPKLGVGKTCSQDTECESAVCVFRGGASRGYCSKECQSWSDCPSFWECQHVLNGSTHYC